MLNAAGQLVEFVLTGQSNFAITTSDFHKTDTINNSVQAKIALKEVRDLLLERFGIMVIAPVIINLERPRTSKWKEALASNRRHLGNYATRQMGENISHEIHLLPGLERRKFKAVLAHELTHAYQAENNLLASHGGLREGMSRWVEYHTLLELGLRDEARKLCNYRSYILGRGILRIIEHEKKHGRQATMNWLISLG